jgi:alpha-ribazole phosphatase
MNLPNGVTNRIIFVRHGEPVAEAKGRCYGKLDVGLSETGAGQIKQTAQWLAQFDIAAVYASPRSRALESAKIIARNCNLFVQPNENLAEINFGDFEGLTYEQAERLAPAVYQKWMHSPTKVEFPNGESFAQMQVRVTKEIEELRLRHEGETFALVSHGGVNRIALAHFLHIENENIFRLEQSYAAANVIDFYDNFPVVRVMNWTAETQWR